MKKLFILFISIWCQISWAGTGGGKITQIIAHSSIDTGGVAMFTTEVNNSKADCSTAGNGKEWAVSLKDDQGKAIYSLLLMAYAQGKNIYVHGSNDCSAWGDRERPSYVRVN